MSLYLLTAEFQFFLAVNFGALFLPLDQYILIWFNFKALLSQCLVLSWRHHSSRGTRTITLTVHQCAALIWTLTWAGLLETWKAHRDWGVWECPLISDFIGHLLEWENSRGLLKKMKNIMILSSRAWTIEAGKDMFKVRNVCVSACTQIFQMLAQDKVRQTTSRGKCRGLMFKKHEMQWAE